MKKFNKYTLLVLIQSVIILCSCKIVSKNQKLFITASGSVEHPVKIRLGNFLSFGVTLDLIDTSNFNKSYDFVPGEMLSINKDTSIRLFYADSLIVDYQNEKFIFHSVNLENTKYNRFYNDLLSALSPIYESELLFFLDKDNSIIQDEQYINNHLCKRDSFITQQVNTLFDKYQFIQSTRFELMSSVLESQKLARSYFYLRNCIPQLDSLGILQVRLQYYLDKINQQHVSVFSQNDISLLIEAIAYHLIGKSINRIKSKAELKNYYSDVQHFFSKGSISYDYLVSSLEVQAKKNNIKFRGSNLRALKQGAKKSIFKNYVEAKYNHEAEELKNFPLDKNLYDTHFSSTDLPNIISQFENKPLLLDFWASWCQPCLKEIPKTIDYKKKYPNLNIVFMSMDKSQDAWKLYLYEHDLMKFPQYRRNFSNQDSLFNRIQEIPKYGLLYKDGHIELFDKLSDSLIKNYCGEF